VKLAPVTHLPFHLGGGGPYPELLKLGQSREIPVYNLHVKTFRDINIK